MLATDMILVNNVSKIRSETAHSASVFSLVQPMPGDFIWQMTRIQNMASELSVRQNV